MYYLEHIYQVTEADQDVVGSILVVSALIHLYMVLFYVWFESHTNELAYSAIQTLSWNCVKTPQKQPKTFVVQKI